MLLGQFIIIKTMAYRIYHDNVRQTHVSSLTTLFQAFGAHDAAGNFSVIYAPRLRSNDHPTRDLLVLILYQQYM